MENSLPGIGEESFKIILDKTWNRFGDALYINTPVNAEILTYSKKYFYWTFYRGHERLKHGFTYNVELC